MGPCRPSIPWNGGEFAGEPQLPRSAGRCTEGARGQVCAGWMESADPMSIPRHLHPTRPLVRHAWLAAPDSALIEFSSGGARKVSAIRAGIFGLLFALSATAVVLSQEPLAAITTTMSAFGLLVSLFVVWRIRSQASARLLPFLTSTVDISLVTGILIAFAVAGRPAVTMNSMFVWELYLLAIMLSVLQFDLRVVLFAGSMALVQWGGVTAWVAFEWGIDTQVGATHSEATLVHVMRFLLIGVFTLGAGLIVIRTNRLARLSGSDALTGLANRALLDQRLVEEVAVARRWGRHLSIAFLDIDRFKKFNDRWGHRAGDEALRATARAMIEECRESDVIARWGGEEFVLVLPDSAGKDAAMVFERVRARLAVTPIPGVSPEARVTLSAGLAEFPTDGDEAGLLERVADRRLLVAKRNGRDRVVAHD